MAVGLPFQHRDPEEEQEEQEEVLQMTEEDGEVIAEFSGEAILTLLITHFATALYELPLRACVLFVGSTGIAAMPHATKRQLFDDLMDAGMNDAESILEGLGIKDFECPCANEALEALDSDVDWEPDSGSESEASA